MLLQLEEIKSNINSPWMRRLQCAGVKSLPRLWSYEVLELGLGLRFPFLNWSPQWRLRTPVWYVEAKSCKGLILKKSFDLPHGSKLFFESDFWWPEWGRCPGKSLLLELPPTNPNYGQGSLALWHLEGLSRRRRASLGLGLLVAARAPKGRTDRKRLKCQQQCLSWSWRTLLHTGQWVLGPDCPPVTIALVNNQTTVSARTCSSAKISPAYGHWRWNTEWDAQFVSFPRSKLNTICGWGNVTQSTECNRRAGGSGWIVACRPQIHPDLSHTVPLPLHNPFHTHTHTECELQ